MSDINHRGQKHFNKIEWKWASICQDCAEKWKNAKDTETIKKCRISQTRGEHFPEFAKNHWGKVPIFWDLGKSLMKFNSVRVVAIRDGEVLTTWRGNFSECKE